MKTTDSRTTPARTVAAVFPTPATAPTATTKAPHSGQQSQKLFFKSRLAPRSSLQYRVGPPFTPTRALVTVFDSLGNEMKPRLTPRIDRGFENAENEWIGYKRNYFTLVSSFEFYGVPFHRFASETFTVIDGDIPKRIKYFALRLRSISEDDESSVALIQHTAKRDNGPSFPPCDQIVVPGALPSHTVVREAANVRNNSKIAKLDKVFFFEKSKHNPHEHSISGLENYPDDKISKVARFERVQFAASVNFKKAYPNMKRFNLIVELVASTADGSVVSIAYTKTQPLLIRGRSPSNYKGEVLPQPRKSTNETYFYPDQTECDFHLFQEPSEFEKFGLDAMEESQAYEILKQATEDLVCQKPTKKSKLKAKKEPKKVVKKTTTSKKKANTSVAAVNKASENITKFLKPKDASKTAPIRNRPKKQAKFTTADTMEFDFDDFGLHNTNHLMNWTGNSCPATPIATTTHSGGLTGTTEMPGQAHATDQGQDVMNFSFDTSFGITKLFQADDAAPIPIFKSVDATVVLQSEALDEDLAFEQELELLKKRRLDQYKNEGMGAVFLITPSKSDFAKENYEETPSAALHYDDQPYELAFDEFPSFSLSIFGF